MKLLATKHQISHLVTNNGKSAMCTDITCTALQALIKRQHHSQITLLEDWFHQTEWTTKNWHDDFLSMMATMMAAF